MQPPTKISSNTWIPTTAIPQSLRSWGFVPDFSTWHPGDLILTSAENPDRISSEIRNIQELGYGPEFACWTHAAVYLGDGMTLCEAQFDPNGMKFGVIIEKIWPYLGTHHLLVKRSRAAADRELGWAIATAAATRIGGAYDWQFVLRMARDRLFLGDRVWQRDRSHTTSPNAFVCSSLYSTAHAYVTDVSIADRTNGLCVPAYLASQDKLLFPVDFGWQRIR